MDEKVISLLALVLLASFIIKNAPKEYHLPVTNPKEFVIAKQWDFLENIWTFTKIMLAFCGFVIGFSVGEFLFARRRLPVSYSLALGIGMALLFYWFAGVLFTLGLISTIALILLWVFTPFGTLIISLLTRAFTMREMYGVAG